MKIAFCYSKFSLNYNSGGTIQLFKTKEYIEKMFGYSIYIVSNPQDITNDTDIVHIFSLVFYDLANEFILQSKKLNIKICVSTIYWDYSYMAIAYVNNRFFGYINSEIIFRLEHILIILLSKVINKPYYYNKRFKHLIGNILEAADALLPNSIEEGYKVLRYVGKLNKNNLRKIFPVVNAIDNTIEMKNIDKYSLPKNFILEVGRIEPNKNQIALVRALFKDKNFPIVFLGKNYEPESKYSKKLYSLAQKRGNVFFFDAVPYDEVPIFYKNALVHILPSLRESPGLVSLEALYYKCQAVVANKNFTPVDTYFKDYVTIINPLNKRSIRNGILKEINTVRDMDSISNYVKNNFSWEHAAEQTVDVYKKLLGV